MAFAQLVIGPPGSGKTTYCNAMKEFLDGAGRKTVIVNLDPANEFIPYECAINISELVALEDVMDALELGPNGGACLCDHGCGCVACLAFPPPRRFLVMSICMRMRVLVASIHVSQQSHEIVLALHTYAHAHAHAVFAHGVSAQPFVFKASPPRDRRSHTHPGLVHCMHYLEQNFDWLREKLEKYNGV